MPEMSSDQDFYIDLMQRCFEQAKSMDPCLAAVGLRELGQQCLERAKELAREKSEQFDERTVTKSQEAKPGP
jgi:hypothetical protein